MREFRMIKVRITYQHEDTGRFASRIVIFGQGVPYLGKQWFVIGQDEFTGLRDKNGKGIWERDIVRCKHGIIGVIEYDDWNEDGGKFWPKREEGFCEIFCDKRRWHYLEVIGNIHEHPELLEAKATIGDSS